MAKKFLENITFVVVLTVLGATDLILALASSKWWISVMGIVATIVAFFIAWLSYRDARRIAEIIDNPKSLTITVVKHGKESESKGQEPTEKPV